MFVKAIGSRHADDEEARGEGEDGGEDEAPHGHGEELHVEEVVDAAAHAALGANQI